MKIKAHRILEVRSAITYLTMLCKEKRPDIQAFLKGEASFYSFASLCIMRQMYSAIKMSQRQKHSPLNSYVSLFEEKEDDLDAETQPPLIDVLEIGKDNSPEQLFLDKEYFAMIEQELKCKLSDLESRVLHLHLLGEDYHSIAKLLDKSPKSIDNALQRIKRKLEKCSII